MPSSTPIHHQAEVMGAEDQAHAPHQGIEFAHGLALPTKAARSTSIPASSGTLNQTAKTR